MLYFSAQRRLYRITFLSFLPNLFLDFLFCICTYFCRNVLFFPPLFLCLFFTFLFSPKSSPHISQLISICLITFLVHYILLTFGKYYQKPMTREINGLDKDYNKMEQNRFPNKELISVHFSRITVQAMYSKTQMFTCILL